MDFVHCLMVKGNSNNEQNTTFWEQDWYLSPG
jgi:hypothetical protein